MGHSRVALAVAAAAVSLLSIILSGSFCCTTFLLPLAFLGFLLVSVFTSNTFNSFLHNTTPPMDDVLMQKEETHKEEKIEKEEEEEEEVIGASECREEVQDTMSNCSDAPSDSQEIELPEEFSSERSTESDSDDESLIEISLPDGHYCSEDGSKPDYSEKLINKGELIWDLLPESVFRQTGLMELLSEINEEDNMIEIDIARGSIKCSSLGIMA